MNCGKTTGKVYLFGSVRKTRGSRKRFQEYKNEMIASDARAGPESGSAIFVNTRHLERPSISAASSSSAGKSRKNWRIKKSPTTACAPNAGIKIIGKNESDNPDLTINLKIGIKVTSAGISSAESKMINILLRHLKLILANAYPPIVEIVTEIMVTTIAIDIEFQY